MSEKKTKVPVPKTPAPRPETVQAKTNAIKAPVPKTPKAAVKRPPQTPAIPAAILNGIIADLERIKSSLEAYAAHLRALDRKRLNTVGVKKEGFAQRAYRLAMDSPEFLPGYLSQSRYTEDYDQYMLIQTAIDLEKQVSELFLNINAESTDYFYTDGLDFYAAVREAAKRRVDAAESIHTELFGFFKKKKSPNAPETEKELLRDIKGYIRGTKDGKAVIENVKPKLSGGIHRVVDEKLTDTARFKETEGAKRL